MKDPTTEDQKIVLNKRNWDDFNSLLDDLTDSQMDEMPKLEKLLAEPTVFDKQEG